MTKKLNFKFTVKNRKIENSESLKKSIGEYVPKLEDWKYIMEIKTDYESRTARQNRAYWWVVMTFLAEYHKIDKEDLHKHIKIEYLTTKFYDPITDTEEDYTRSSTSLNKKEFTELIRNIEQDYLDQYWVQIPKIKENV